MLVDSLLPLVPKQHLSSKVKHAFVLQAVDLCPIVGNSIEALKRDGCNEIWAEISAHKLVFQHEKIFTYY